MPHPTIGHFGGGTVSGREMEHFGLNSRCDQKSSDTCGWWEM